MDISENFLWIFIFTKFFNIEICSKNMFLILFSVGCVNKAKISENEFVLKVYLINI